VQVAEFSLTLLRASTIRFYERKLLISASLRGFIFSVRSYQRLQKWYPLLLLH